MSTISSSSPRVSVLMSVYNGAPYLSEAIQSILDQTFIDFEFIIIDDASTDKSRSIIESYDDPRIQLLVNETNLGLASSLNRGIDSARGRYIARMDADDVALPMRLAHQYSFMENHANLAATGSYACVLGGKQLLRHPTRPEYLAANLLFRTSLIHPTVMFRKSFLEEHHLRYDPALKQTQDYDLFTRMAHTGALGNLPKVLLLYRQHDKQTSQEKRVAQMVTARAIMEREFTRIGVHATPEELDAAVSVKRYSFPRPLGNFLTVLDSLLTKINDANRGSQWYADRALKQTLGEVWLETCIALSRSRVPVRRAYLGGRAHSWIRPTPRNLLRSTRLLITTRG